MTFKEFLHWCEERSCDGLWGSLDALVCLDIVATYRKIPWWKPKKRREYWDSVKDEVFEEIVNPINKKIKEVYGID